MLQDLRSRLGCYHKHPQKLLDAKTTHARQEERKIWDIHETVGLLKLQPKNIWFAKTRHGATCFNHHMGSALGPWAPLCLGPWTPLSSPLLVLLRNM